MSRTLPVLALAALLIGLPSSHLSAELGRDWVDVTTSAPWHARVYHTATAFQAKMFLVGGELAGDAWYTADGAKWVQIRGDVRWSFRRGHTALVFKNRMWVMGGSLASELNDVWYSWDGLRWTTATTHAQWAPRYHHASVVYDGKMWVLGGIHQSQGPRNDVWYSTNGTTWTCATTRLPFNMWDECDAVAHAGRIWVLGTVGVWCSSNGTSWTQITANPPWFYPMGRRRPKAISLDGKIWVIGGQDFYYAMGVPSVWYSADGINWKMATSNAPCTARIGHAVVGFDGKLWVLGGLAPGYRGSQGTLFHDVWYSAIPIRPTSTTSWTRYP